MAPNKNFIMMALQKEWNKVPEWRFMQLINNFQSYIGSDGFYIDDEQLIYRLKEYLDVVLKEGDKK